MCPESRGNEEASRNWIKQKLKAFIDPPAAENRDESFSPADQDLLASMFPASALLISFTDSLRDGGGRLLAAQLTGSG